MNCFKCLKKLELAFADSGSEFENMKEPRYGLIFSAAGNYGSRVFDPTVSAPQLVVWICDDCIVKHKELVEVRRYAHVRTDITWTDFDPDLAYW